MAVTGKLPCHEFITGDGGRRFSYRFGKIIAGNTFEGRKWEQIPETALTRRSGSVTPPGRP